MSPSNQVLWDMLMEHAEPGSAVFEALKQSPDHEAACVSLLAELLGILAKDKGSEDLERVLSKVLARVGAGMHKALEIHALSAWHWGLDYEDTDDENLGWACRFDLLGSVEEETVVSVAEVSGVGTARWWVGHVLGLRSQVTRRLDRRFETFAEAAEAMDRLAAAQGWVLPDDKLTLDSPQLDDDGEDTE